MIEREMVEQMFEEMKGEGVETDTEMNWGYYFTDPDMQKLEGVIPALEAQGFEFVEILEAETEDGTENFFVLHIERTESHSVESLHSLNQELDAFANKYSLESYDGMDVSPGEDMEDFEDDDMDDDFDDEDEDFDDEEDEDEEETK